MDVEFANNFLKQRGATLDDLRSYVPELAASDAVLLVGSVAEGLANHDSDIDLLLLGARRPEGFTYEDHGSFVVNALRKRFDFDVQVEVWPPEVVAELCGRYKRGLDLMLGGMQDVDSGKNAVPVLNLIESRFLHRLRDGIVLANPREVERLRNDYQLELLTLPLFFNYLGNHYAMLEDAIAQHKYGDPDTARWMLRDAADFFAGCMLTGARESHPYPKWRITLLRRHADILGQDHVDEMIELLFVDRSEPLERALQRLITHSNAVLERIYERFPGIRAGVQSYQARLGFNTVLES